MISSFYMHSTLCAEIINGLDTMKYVVNHPGHFKRRALADDIHEDTSPEDGWYIRFLYAFMLGFTQYFLTIILEFMTIIFINSQTSYLFILLFYAALAGVTTFDNMYANALPIDHSIKKVVGKNFYQTFHRFMKFKAEREHVEASLNVEEKIEGEHKINLAAKSLIIVPNPRDGRWLFQFFRFFYKSCRMFHVSFFFYFAPFIMLVYQFYLS